MSDYFCAPQKQWSSSLYSAFFLLVDTPVLAVRSYVKRPAQFLGFNIASRCSSLAGDINALVFDLTCRINRILAMPGVVVRTNKCHFLVSSGRKASVYQVLAASLTNRFAASMFPRLAQCPDNHGGGIPYLGPGWQRAGWCTQWLSLSCFRALDCLKL